MLFNSLSAIALSSALAAFALPGRLLDNDAQQFPIQVNDQTFPESWHLLKEEKRTIYQVISEDSKYSLITKAINFSESIVDILNDTSAEITFFALPDWALKRPHRKGHKHHHRKHRHRHLEQSAEIFENLQLYIPSDFEDLSEILPVIDDLELTSDDEPDKEKRKKWLKKIVGAILSYHVLPKGLDTQHLISNTTHATKLALPKVLDGEPQRIRVKGFSLAGVYINIFSKVFNADIGASNGIIHGITRPLLPPPATFQEIFLFPRIFSIATTALQRTGLTDELDLHWARGEEGERGHLKGATSVTFFAPSNRAFEKLPRKLRLFLFSPFGERALKKILQFHIIPSLVVHSDYIHNTTSSSHVDLGYFEESMSDIQPINEEYIEEDFGQESLRDLLYDAMVTNWDPRGSPHGKSWPESPLSRRQDCHPIPPPPHGHGPPPPPLLGHEPPPLPPSGHPSPPGQDWHPRHPFPPQPPAPPIGGWPHPPRPLPSHHPILSTKLTLPTLLANHSLHVRVAKYKTRLPFPGHKKTSKITTKVFVNGQVVIIPDLVAANGAVHAIHNVLVPSHHHHHHHHRHGDHEDRSEDDILGEGISDEWEDWEDWLPQWALES